MRVWRRLVAFGNIWGVLVPYWARLVLGHLGCVLGPNWGVSEASWGRLGEVLGGSGAVLCASWGVLEAFGFRFSCKWIQTDASDLGKQFRVDFWLISPLLPPISNEHLARYLVFGFQSWYGFLWNWCQHGSCLVPKI